jgi:serine/threonine protein phosphatase 1
MGRTIAIGDIHGDLAALERLFVRLPALTTDDTVVFLGDYVDRGPHSKEVVARVRAFPAETAAKVVTLRGNHEDGWLRVIDDGWVEFAFPPGNGCRPCLASFRPDLVDDLDALFSGSFLPADVVAWMRTLPFWYEDDNAIFVHAGLPQVDGRWRHPSEVADPRVLIWQRARAFYLEYKGKPVVCGHTRASSMPPGMSQYTPDDPEDLFWAGGGVYLIDTGAGKDGFLTALELPSGQVYESR